MNEIDVSLIADQDCSLLSASRFELGDNAGQITWRNCLALAERHPLIDDTNRDDARDHLADYGAWERSEIDAWTDVEISAMIWQEAAADYRDFAEYCDGVSQSYERACEQGQISGRLSFDPETCTWHIYLGC